MGALRRDVFQGIADPTRRGILTLIKDEPMTLNAIAEQFEISRPAISQHVKLLSECGLVVVKSRGRERYCEPQFEQLAEVAEWIEPMREMWEARFNELDSLLNEMKTKAKKDSDG